MARLPTPGSDKGSWGDILNQFLRVSHNNDGTLKSSQVNAASGVLPGISHQTATVYEACDLKANANDLQGSFGFETTDTTITGASNGHLIADGVSVTAGQRIAVASSSNYGPETYNGIYTVTSTGSVSSKYLLTRTNDDLSDFFAVRILDGNDNTNATIYFYPLSLPVDLGSTQIATQTEAYGASVEGLESNAMGEAAHAESNGEANGAGSHAEGSSTANGTNSHAENAASAEGDYSHAEGGASATGDFSHAEGGSIAHMDYMHAEGIDSLHQFNRITCSQSTSGAQTKPFYNGTDNHIYTFLDGGFSALVTVRVVARRIGTNDTVSAWQAQCMVNGNGSSYSIVGDPSFAVIAQDTAASTWSVSDIEVDGDDQLSLNVSVSGVTSRVIAWEATVEVDQVRG